MDIDKLFDDIEDAHLMVAVAYKKIAKVHFEIQVVKFNLKQLKAKLKSVFREQNPSLANSPAEDFYVYDFPQYQSVKFTQLQKEQEKMELEGEVKSLLQKINTNENLLNFYSCQPLCGEDDGGCFEDDAQDFWKGN